MNTEMFIYGFLLFWGVVVVTHALTIASCTTPIIEVVGYKTIDRTPNMLTYQDEFIISEQDVRMVPPEILLGRELRRSKERLFFKLPDHCF